MTVAGDKECKSSNSIEVEMLGEGIPLFREINSTGEGKLCNPLGDFHGILLGNPEKLGDFTGEFLFFDL